jgi:ABC-type dipeptide/oligopeptide/nickel transport system permease component
MTPSRFFKIDGLNMKKPVLYLAQRIGFLCLLLWGIITIAFILTRALGTPVYLLVGQQADKEIIESLIKSMGLDRPLYEQYFRYFWSVLHGNLGISRYTFRPVTQELSQRLPATLELVLAAMVLITIIGILLGISAAVYNNTLFDRCVQAFCQFGASVPLFWLGLILIYIFFYLFKLAPAPLGRIRPGLSLPKTITGFLLVDAVLLGDRECFLAALKQIMLPAVTLALGSLPATIRIVYLTILDILNTPYINTARAYSIPRWRILFVYALRNALVPISTVLAMTFGYLLSNTVFVEAVFAWPGIGNYAITAMYTMDYDPIIAVTIVATLGYGLAYLLNDIFALIVDPRVRR